MVVRCLREVKMKFIQPQFPTKLHVDDGHVVKTFQASANEDLRKSIENN